MARIRDGDWEKSIQARVDNQRSEGVTHFLLVQRDGSRITHAALIPIDGVLGIWCAQRDVSTELIKQGRLGRRRKNHAMNGSSLTLYLQDDQAKAVATQLWTHKGVVDPQSAAWKSGSVVLEESLDDTFDDLAGVTIGSDNPSRLQTQRSYVRRDPLMRKTVLARSGGVCERPTCAETRDYGGFLDVHHILGAAKSDCVANCVAICPNCHREAHFAPDRDRINAMLLLVAKRYSMNSKVTRKRLTSE